MALAYDIQYSNLVLAQILANPGFLGRLNNLIEIPDGAQAGSVTATLLDAVTVTTIADGTMLTNDTGQTAVALTLVDKAATLALKPSAAKSSLTKPANLATIAANHAGAFVQNAQEQVIVKTVAATPGITNTLTVGQVDFTTDGTVGEATDNLRKFTQVAIKCWNEHSDLNPSDFTIVMAPTAHANFVALRATGEQNAILGQNGIYSFMGMPIYSFKYSTDWGAASKECAFIFNRRNYAMKFLNVGLHGGGPMAASDGTTKWISICSYVHGVILDDTIGAIINPAS